MHQEEQNIHSIVIIRVQSQSRNGKFVASLGIMDPLSATASIAGLVGLAVQITTSIKQLHAFWSAVSDAPTSLRYILADIQLIRDLFHNIEASFVSTAMTQSTLDLMDQLLKRCLLDLNSLENFVQTVLPVHGDSLRKATWKSIKSALKADKLKSYREHLESAKVTLVLAHSYANEYVPINFFCF